MQRLTVPVILRTLTPALVVGTQTLTNGLQLTSVQRIGPCLIIFFKILLQISELRGGGGEPQYFSPVFSFQKRGGKLQEIS